MNILLTILSILYAGVGIIVVVGYLPTIRDLRKKVASANIHSYMIWTFCAGVTFLYAFFVVSDLLLEIVTGLNFISCLVILISSLKLISSNK